MGVGRQTLVASEAFFGLRSLTPARGSPILTKGVGGRSPRREDAITGISIKQAKTVL